jgi:hypothetical protein
VHLPPVPRVGGDPGACESVNESRGERHHPDLEVVGVRDEQAARGVPEAVVRVAQSGAGGRAAVPVAQSGVGGVNGSVISGQGGDDPGGRGNDPDAMGGPFCDVDCA